MASTIKFTHDAMCSQNAHIDREHNNPSNTDIDSERTHLNYSFPMGYSGMKPFQYYKQRIGEVYMYGRGSKREKDAVTGCGWIVTLPKELYGYPEKERAFFQGVFDFISERYGRENIINNSIHYDEAGLPHIHVIFSPVTNLDHEIVQYKTKRTTQAVKLESGRYEYKHIHVNKKGRPVDENNPDTWVKLNNYARMSDYYDQKVDCNSVLNRIELLHFHPDLQKYLDDHGIEGRVVTGNTGVNFTVKELKDFTAATGMRLDDVNNMLHGDKSLLESFVEDHAKVSKLEQILSEKESVIEALKEEISLKDITVSEKDKELSRAADRNSELENKIAEAEKNITSKQAEIDHLNARVEELEKGKEVVASQSEHIEGWGRSSSSWGDRSQSGWGAKNTANEEVKTW